MDIRGLRYFIKLAECLNFTHAAKECFITQTAMSQNIAKMEEELGFQLFKRNNRSVELTPAGRDFYGRMYMIVKEYDDAVEHSSNIANGREGRLRVAMPNGVDGLNLMPAMKEFKKRYPSVTLNSQITDPGFFDSYLKQRKVDMVVTWVYDKLPVEEGRESFIFAHYPIKVAVGKGHPFAECEKITKEMLMEDEHTFLTVNSIAGIKESIAATWGNNIANRIKIGKMRNPDDVLIAIEMDQSLAFLPSYMQKFVNGDVVFVDLDIEPVPVVSMMAQHLKNNDNPALARFVEILYKMTE